MIQLLDPESILSCEGIEEASSLEHSTFHLSAEAKKAIEQASLRYKHLVDSGRTIYGSNTGFGPFVKFDNPTGTGGVERLEHLAAGAGPSAPGPIVLASMYIRAHTIARGYSAVTPPVLTAYVDLMNHRIIPVVPEIGSVGASGDLTPLSHIMRTLCGRGRVLHGDETRPAKEALREAGLNPIEVDHRSGLALVNGTSFSCAYAAFALSRAARLLLVAEKLTGLIYRVLGCSLEPLHPELHRLRGHEGQMLSATHIRDAASQEDYAHDRNRALQEVYSIRCAPQILGACRDQLAYARRIIEAEINGISDNPVFLEQDVVHGGNFQGQHLAFAADALNAAVTQTGVLAERQISVLLDPASNGGAPLLLAWNPGSTSGLAGAQITATALVAEMRHSAQHAAVQSIPTNGRNQDIVSMCTLAARTAYTQTTRLASTLAVLALSLAQLSALRSEQEIDSVQKEMPDWIPPFHPVKEDRALFSDIERFGRAFLSMEKTTKPS